MLLILVAARFEMCRNGAFQQAGADISILLPKFGNLQLHSLITRRFADALIEKGDRQGVSHTSV
jgi:hypothetical protein